MSDNVIGEIVRQGPAVIVSFKMSIISNVDDISSISSQLEKFIETDPPTRIIFDFEGVKFFSSQVLGLLLETRAKLQPRGGHVAVSSINPQLHRVFKITNLDQVFEFYPDRQAAVETGQSD